MLYDDGRKEVHPLGRSRNGAVIECDKQFEKQTVISLRNLAEQRNRQPTRKR